jgi:hypothetical protein
MVYHSRFYLLYVVCVMIMIVLGAYVVAHDILFHVFIPILLQTNAKNYRVKLIEKR